MQKLLRKSSVVLAVVLGFIFLIPFIVLEIVNRWGFNEGFPFAVFIFAWVLQTIFALILMPMIKTVRLGKSLTAKPIVFLLQVFGLVLVAYIWTGWIIDQWPCLMGVPNCD